MNTSVQTGEAAACESEETERGKEAVNINEANYKSGFTLN